MRAEPDGESTETGRARVLTVVVCFRAVVFVSQCDEGLCVGTSKVCSPSNDCNTPACNSSTGDCYDVPKPDGSDCTHPDLCTDNDQVLLLLFRCVTAVRD